MNRRMNTRAEELTFDQLADATGGRIDKKIYWNMNTRIYQAELEFDEMYDAFDLLDLLKNNPDQDFTEKYIDALLYSVYGI